MTLAIGPRHLELAETKDEYDANPENVAAAKETLGDLALFEIKASRLTLPVKIAPTHGTGMGSAPA